MKKIYEAENPALVWSARLIVEGAGIPCTILNQFSGGASGLLAPLDAWPQLWVIDDRRAERAKAVLENTVFGPSDAVDWHCSNCQEVNASSFGLCWNCGAVAPAVAD